MLTLGWSNGNSFVPVNHCLLSVADDKNLLCEAAACVRYILTWKHQKLWRRKSTGIMLELINTAKHASLSAEYMLFGYWLSSPKVVLALKQDYGPNTIAMSKRVAK